MNNISLFFNDVMNVADAEFKEAWELQTQIAHDRQVLADKETRLTELMDKLIGRADEVFAVANLKPYRIVETPWVKANMPEVYDKLVKVSDTNTGKVLHATYTREQVNQYLKEQNPEMFERVANISITDLEKELGKTRTKELEGIAFKTEMRVVSKTQIVVKHPEKYEQLPAGEGEAEEDA